MASRSQPPPSSWAQRTLVFLLLAVLGAGFYVYLQREVLRRWFAQDLIGREMEILSEKIDHLQKQLAEAQAELERLSPSTPSERVLEVFGAEPDQQSNVDEREMRCVHLARKLENLFVYLDGRDYVRDRIPPVASRDLLGSLLSRSVKKPPIVAKETENILRVLQNSAHFFRTLGKTDTLLVAALLRQEGELMEPTFQMLYELVGPENECREQGVTLSISLPEAYPYAAYFLNTLGGQSYLLRRDSRVRLLTQYYAILILDRANEEKLNEWGLDIRIPLRNLLTDMKSAGNLVRKREYLKRLLDLNAKYEELYGG